MRSRLVRFGAALAAGLLAAQLAHGAATITIVNLNAAGVGFNDPTPVAPVGGNIGTTLGQQRLIAFQAAASVWGATLTSTAVIVVNASFEPLTCTATSAVLGSAGANTVWRDFTGAPVPATWYAAALANKIFGADLDPATADMTARFNVNLGNPGCLTGTPFYLGLDNNHGTAVDLFATLLHEFGHGLGFQTFTNGTTGAQLVGFPAIWDRFLYDSGVALTWANMTNAQRVTSAIGGNLVWSGPNVVASVPLALSQGVPQLTVAAPASLAGVLQVGTAAFGPLLPSTGLSGQVMPVVDTGVDVGLACTPLSAANATAVNGKIAMVDRGTCGFTVKVANVQAAGAIAAIVVDNVAGSPPPGMAGVDPLITIPSVRITLADGLALKNFLRFRSRTTSGLNVTLGLDLTLRAYADSANRPYMNTPNPFQGGSSVSHWDPRMFPNMLMEPSINADLTHSVVMPQDMTFELFKDIGW